MYLKKVDKLSFFLGQESRSWGQSVRKARQVCLCRITCMLNVDWLTLFHLLSPFPSFTHPFLSSIPAAKQTALSQHIAQPNLRYHLLAAALALTKQSERLHQIRHAVRNVWPLVGSGLVWRA